MPSTDPRAPPSMSSEGACPASEDIRRAHSTWHSTVWASSPKHGRNVERGRPAAAGVGSDWDKRDNRRPASDHAAKADFVAASAKRTGKTYMLTVVGVEGGPAARRADGARKVVGDPALRTENESRHIHLAQRPRFPQQKWVFSDLPVPTASAREKPHRATNHDDIFRGET